MTKQAKKELLQMAQQLLGPERFADLLKDLDAHGVGIHMDDNCKCMVCAIERKAMELGGDLTMAQAQAFHNAKDTHGMLADFINSTQKFKVMRSIYDSKNDRPWHILDNYIQVAAELGLDYEASIAAEIRAFGERINQLYLAKKAAEQAESTKLQKEYMESKRSTRVVTHRCNNGHDFHDDNPTRPIKMGERCACGAAIHPVDGGGAPVMKDPPAAAGPGATSGETEHPIASGEATCRH